MGDDVSSDLRTLPDHAPAAGPRRRLDNQAHALRWDGGEDWSGGGSVSPVRATLPPWLSSS